MNEDLFDTLGTVSIVGADIAVASDNDGDNQTDDGKQDNNTDQADA